MTILPTKFHFQCILLVKVMAWKCHTFIRKYLTRSATEKLVHSLISSSLDFGNGLLYNLPNSQIGQLQKLQNAAARIVSLSSKRSHITPILKTLHWLPVKERIIFTSLLFVYYIVNGTAPDYNKSLLRLYQPTRTLWSSNSGLLQIPLSQEILGERAFAHAGPALWNSFPQELKDSNSSTSFKCNLKTHLFNLAFWRQILFLYGVHVDYIVMFVICFVYVVKRLEHLIKMDMALDINPTYYYYYTSQVQ